MRRFLNIFEAYWSDVFFRRLIFGNDIKKKPDMSLKDIWVDLFPKTKGLLKNDLALCSGCGECMKICPSSAIGMDTQVNRDGTAKVNRFDIDFGKCVFCSACVEICPVKSIVHTRNYCAPSFFRKDLVLKSEEDRESSSNKKEKIHKIRSYEIKK